MVKYHSDSERGNPLLPYGLLRLTARGLLYTLRIVHTTAFVTPVVKATPVRDCDVTIFSMFEKYSNKRLRRHAFLGLRNCIIFSPLNFGFVLQIQKAYFNSMSGRRTHTVIIDVINWSI